MPCVLCLYYRIAPHAPRRTANFLLVTASLVFYGYFEWRYIFLIIGSLCFNYFVSIGIAKSRKKSLLVAGIATNLILLGFYKYMGFFLENLNLLFNSNMPIFQLALPLGISFFTFQQIAFLVDIYHRKADEADFSRYCLFVTFFPQLIAGPIVHHKEMIPQFKAAGAKRFHAVNFAEGLLIFTVGLAKKVIVADNCAPFVEALFEKGGTGVGMSGAWIGVFAYTMQLYFDFSGYSDMAIGLGKLFNINIPQNFDSPYKAVNIADFWRRWHMTLSRFLKEYLYIPLGGNRLGGTRMQLNIMITMVLGGLWHGANWTFVAWGAYHGFLLLISKGWTRYGLPLPVVLARAVTFVCVMIGWVFFRAASITDAFRIIGRMFHFDGWVAPRAFSVDIGPLGITGMAFLLVLVNFFPSSLEIMKRNTFQPRYAIGYGVLFFLCLLSMHEAVITHVPTKFLYFDF